MSLDQTLKGIERAAKFGKFGAVYRNVVFDGYVQFTPTGALLYQAGALTDDVRSHLISNGLNVNSLSIDDNGFIRLDVQVDCFYDNATLVDVGYSIGQTVLGTQTGYVGVSSFASINGLIPREIPTCGNYYGSGTSGANSNTGTYIVQSGDTLSGIARQFGLTLNQLLALNPQISNPNLIQIGQVINVAQGSNNNPTVNTNPITAPATQHATSNTPLPPKNPAGQNALDKFLFTGAGTLSGVAIAVLIVVGTGIVLQRR